MICFQRTIDTRYEGPRLEHLLQPAAVSVTVVAEAVEVDTVVSLEEVVATPRDEAVRARRLSLSTLVIDLALVVRQGIERLRMLKKENDV